MAAWFSLQMTGDDTAPVAQFGREATMAAAQHPLALLMLGLFLAAYLAVVLEEKTGISKSKPTLLAAGLLWICAALLAQAQGVSAADINAAVTHNLGEFAELFMFLLVALVFIKRLEERHVFEVLKWKLVSRGYSYRRIYWSTGIISFFLSAVADNLTTALVMGAVVLAVGTESRLFTRLGCINVVVACNAGGAFSPFGDITTLMVWQANKLGFFDFFAIFLPSVVTYLLPAAIIGCLVPARSPKAMADGHRFRRQGRMTILLFACTIAMAVGFKHWLGLPPYMGMMMGLALLMFSAHWGARRLPRGHPEYDENMFKGLESAEWDTLLFFFGIMYCIGALAFVGYLDVAAQQLYGEWGASVANIVAGLSSAVIDNIPVMFAILQMNPQMDSFQWLLITLTAGVGGSLLSVGSAAGVALMGAAKGRYTFMSHLLWSWAILLGYAAGVATHFWLNG